ncbi:MAG: class I SAM-dependent methyltransferase [Planctomycetota bacterium]
MSSLASDLRVLRQLLLHRTTGTNHKERLESFYGGQASDYDSFRRRLLHGRSDLFDRLEFPGGGVWADMGCGTGENLEHVGARLGQLSHVHLIDLSESLLSVARQRVGRGVACDVSVHNADATEIDLQDESVDVVTFSYSLTMIPDWFSAIENAWRMLRPNGCIGVVDFYVSRKHAAPSATQHGWWSRTFWQNWFAMDNVFLQGDHLAMLQRRFTTVDLQEDRGDVPYLPMLKAPFYAFVGRK